MKTRIEESSVRYWSQLLADQSFGSEREARNEIFRISEQRSRQSWSTPIGKNTIPENRQFAKSMPIHRSGDQWKVGRPLNEYLTMTPDFSDRTNAEPSVNAPSAGDALTATGLPDYKYVERRKARREKLRALLQRRDPDGVSSNPEDIQIRSGLGR